MIRRRGLLAGFASLLAAPAIARAELLMPTRTPRAWKLVGDGITDDALALQWAMDEAYRRGLNGYAIPRGRYALSGPLYPPGNFVMTSRDGDPDAVILMSRHGGPTVHVRDDRTMITNLSFVGPGRKAIKANGWGSQCSLLIGDDVRQGSAGPGLHTAREIEFAPHLEAL